MSNVKAFYLTKYSKCPKCGGKLEHIVDAIVGAMFDCTECKTRLDFGDYIIFAIHKLEKGSLMKTFEGCYYEVNK
ncbi:hypothetical protein LCGC14_0371800 [marine sediment metagenome]|uniref:Uncharacterized protein n=1 Tax=marine sediment metagenome TaxID=412755 RepID=A0A0F9WDN7_9ZZZZ